eukprot:gene5508-6065_t
MFFRSLLFLSLLTFTLSKKSSSKKEEDGGVITSDLPYIACEVCEHFVQAVVEEVKELRKHAIGNKIEEYTVSEVIDSACQPTNQTGQWIRELDIITTTQGVQSYLHLDQPGGVSKCNRECKTITKSCQDLLDHDLEVDDLSAYLWKRKTYSIKEVTKKVCKEMSTRCSKKPKALPTNFHRVDYPFEAISEKDLEMEKLMASMQAMGLGGSMYNRDDMMNMAGMMGGGLGGEEDGYDGEDSMMNFGMGGGGLGGAGHGQYGEDEEDGEGWEV